MGSFLLKLDTLNSQVLTAFGTETIIYQQRSNQIDIGSPVSILAIPIDPLRLEKQSNGNIAVRWVQTHDLLDWQGQPFQPQKGDVVTLAATAISSSSPWPVAGGAYTLVQIQEDTGGGVHLVLEKRSGA